jgi:YgiT-type zinc finger domain-containing protein
MSKPPVDPDTAQLVRDIEQGLQEAKAGQGRVNTPEQTGFSQHVCPACGHAGTLVHEARSLPFEYRGRRTVFESVRGVYCTACAEGFSDPQHPQDWQRYSEQLSAFCAARAGVALRVHVLHDVQAGCYVATSPDLSGLVVEAKSLDALVQEVDECIGMLLTDRAP